MLRIVLTLFVVKSDYMIKEELDKILADHKLWLADNTKGKRADLRGADLRGADLLGADLRGADLEGADLQSANLQGADLRYADLRGADLRRADLRWADLRWADLQSADLHGANLRGANLRDAGLHGANLRGANLQGAALQGANLLGADLRGASAAIGMQCGNIDGYFWYVINDRARVGCQEHAFDVWEKLTPEDAQQWASDGADWWRKHGPLILAAIKSVKQINQPA